MPFLRTVSLFLLLLLVACAPAPTGDLNSSTPHSPDDSAPKDSAPDDSAPDAATPEQRALEPSPTEVEPDQTEESLAADRVDEPQAECRTNADCTTASIGPDCCPSCFSVGYSHERLAEVRERCAAQPELRQSCPALGCAFQHGIAICHEGRCQATNPEPSVFF